MPSRQRIERRPFAAERGRWCDAVEALLAALEREYTRWRAGLGAPPAGLMREIGEQHLCWARGVPPTRRWLGRGAQNPRLLEAFRRLAAVDGWRDDEETRR